MRSNPGFTAVAVLSLRQFLALRTEQVESGDDLGARLRGVDHVVDESALGRSVRIGEPLGVLLDQFRLTSIGVGRHLQLAPVHDLDRALEYVEQSIAHNSLNNQAQCLKALVLQKLGRPGEANAVAQAVLESDPGPAGIVD